MGFVKAACRTAMLWLAASFAATAVVADTVVVYAATDRQIVEPLIADFEQLHPAIKVDYRDMNSAELFARFLQETGEKAQADIVWSSAMDLQMKLVNDGHALPHRSAETASLPAWAIWKGEAFGTTYEPVGFVYNRRLLEPDKVPRTHAELARRLAENSELLRQRLTAYDPRRAGVGYLLHSQDMEANPVVFWSLVRAMGRAGLTTEPTTASMLDRISSGRAVLGYNMLASYALARAATDANVGVVLPSDYTLVISRVAFISRHAPHPAAARAWLDHVLSQRGQAILNRIGLFSVREDIAGESPAAALRKQLGKAFRPVVLGTGLLTYMDRMKREIFLGRWDAALRQPADELGIPLPGTAAKAAR